MAEAPLPQSRSDDATSISMDGLKLSIATQQARQQLGELDVTLTIDGFIDLCKMAQRGLQAPLSERGDSEYICKCGVRITPHRCSTGTDF